ncbi:A24 family peptidase [Gordonia hydrophobica]|uniref:A24 family peptidase n=1 Tax=Gordonia hydrophobica TaxID=40516 RepID=A0ABZ2U048_9ACTN|nr:A24 family peptidase [Gordonia hydrophobica]MBM7367816.1 leader peptidase (prepilin peptidase)/N-methyltransferase [Gordonia hydrophobica]
MMAAGVLVLWSVLVAMIDHRTGRIPNRLVMPAVAGTIGVAVLLPTVGLSAAALTVPYVVAFAVRAVGGGDVKLAVPCGGMLADPALALVAAGAAAVATLVVCAVTKRSRHPHGPALVGSTVLLMMLKWQVV